MAASKQSNRNPYAKLKRFLKNNADETLRTLDLRDPSIHDSLNWKGVKKSDIDLHQQLRAYQRLLRIAPAEAPEGFIFALLKADLDSALKIAAIPLPRFLNDFQKVSKDEEVLRTCHRNAVAIRSQVLLHYLKRKQAAATPTA
jgi:hypothetical protein